MSDAPLPPAPEVPPARPRGVRRRALSRWTTRLLAGIAAIIAAIFITIFSVDIGTIRVGRYSLKALAERQATNYLERPMTIGRISALLTPGQFALDDVVIQGLTPASRPFFRAKRITVYVPWWQILASNRIVVEVQLSGWQMLVETFEGGRNNMPKLTPKRKEPTGPKKYTTRVNFVYAEDGEFAYEDHATPWSVVCRNLGFKFVWSDALKTYAGTAEFRNGTVQIQKYLPMRADMRTRFFMDGAIVRLQHIDLKTDGAETHVNGFVNFPNWPESTYNVESTVDFPTMHAIFFPNEKWQLGGTGRFTGIFRLYKNAPISRELRGEFASHEARVDIGETTWRFGELHGALEWLPSRFAVTHADSEFLGGTMRLAYALEPLGRPGGAGAKFEADYTDVDLRELVHTFDWTELLPDGRMTGHVRMGWPSGRFSAGLDGTGESTITPAGGAANASATLPASAPESTHFGADEIIPPYGRFPFGGHMTYRFTGGGLEFDDSWASTPATYISFRGRVLGGPVNLPFHVTSHDWQESDRLFAAIMNEFTGRTSAIAVGGRGTFDGVMTESFRAPRIEGRFASEDMHAFNVTWGRATGNLVIENGFMQIADGVVSGRTPGSAIRTEGRYSLGYKPGQEEMNAHVRVEHWPLEDLRAAFGLDDWPVEGTVGLADMQLRGPYRELLGTGKMQLDDATAWKEPFEKATGDLLFEGDGLRINRIEMTKSTGRVLGNAWIGWTENSYSFTANGERLPVESLKNFQLSIAPLTGLLQFRANGAGSFDAPTYEFDGQITDLYAGDEGIGQVRAHLTVRDDVLTIDRLDAASPRLTVFGSGSIAMNESSDAQLFFRFLQSSLDPYLKFFAPQLSPYARAIATGSVSVAGPLGQPEDLVIAAKVEDVQMTLLDYALQNKGEVTLVYEENAVKIPGVALVGADTELEIAGAVDIGNDHATLEANGTASLAILQLFYPELLASGRASIKASLDGPLDASKLALTGTAEITDGRLKPASFPQGLSEINGPIRVDAKAIRIDGLRGVIGGGVVTFGGAIPLEGYRPERFDLTAKGQAIQLRYPPDVRSTVRLDLKLAGPITGPTLSGTVDVLEARYAPRVSADTGLVGFVAGGAPAAAPAAPGLAPEPAVPIRLDVVVRARPTAFIDNERARIVGTALFDVAGTVSQPAITGRIDIRSGRWSFGGNTYTIRRGSISFDDPQSLDPYFDVEAVTRVRATGQSYDVTLGMNGTISKFTPTITSEPWLPEYQIIALLFGETSNLREAELRARGSSQELQAQALRQTMTVLLSTPISSRIGEVVERIVPVDTVDVIPLLGSETSLQQLSPTARVVFGRRISERVYLTYSRTLGAAQYELILLEYDQNDRVSWVLSRNEDRSFSLDFRIRYVF